MPPLPSPPPLPPPYPHHYHYHHPHHTTIPSPHYQLLHTITTPTDRHRTNGPEIRPHKQNESTEKSSAPRRRTRSHFRSHHHATTESPPDLAVSVCTRQNLVSAMIQSSSQQPFLFHSKQTHTDTASSGSAAGPVWQLASDGALDLNGGAILSLVRFGLLAQLPLCR